MSAQRKPDDPATAIRECLKVIVADHRQESQYPLCYAGCAGSWPCIAYIEATEALAQWDLLMKLLAEAERGISFNGDSKSILQQIIKANEAPDA